MKKNNKLQGKLYLLIQLLTLNSAWSKMPHNPQWAVTVLVHSLLRSLVRLLARSLAHSLTPELMGKRFLSINWRTSRFHIVSAHCAILPTLVPWSVTPREKRSMARTRRKWSECSRSRWRTKRDSSSGRWRKTALACSEPSPTKSMATKICTTGGLVAQVIANNCNVL